MLFRRISLQFMTGFCILGEEMVCFKIVLKTSVFSKDFRRLRD